MAHVHVEATRVGLVAVHPDHNRGDSGAFIQVQRAYENLIKHRGEDVPVGHDSWNFHDWCVLVPGDPAQEPYPDPGSFPELSCPLAHIKVLVKLVNHAKH